MRSILLLVFHGFVQLRATIVSFCSKSEISALLNRAIVTAFLMTYWILLQETLMIQRSDVHVTAEGKISVAFSLF